MEMKLLALASRLDCSPSQAAKKIEKKMYLVLTYEEATELAMDKVKDKLHELDPVTLSNYAEVSDLVFSVLQSCKDKDLVNDAIEELLGDFSDFAVRIIEHKGPAYFIGSYNLREMAEEVGEETYYIYPMLPPADMREIAD